jgi:RNA polymerase sigma-70 factor, ECF subfamily
MLVDQLGNTDELKSYYLYHAARADVLKRMRRVDEALEEYQRAIALTTNTVEQQYLRRRLVELTPDG